MKLSPHQVRSVLNIKEQTLRYWKQAFPSLAGRRGYGPCYTFGEVLTLLITKRLVEQLGADVRKLQPAVEALFSLCSTSVSLLSGIDKVVSIDLESMIVKPVAGELAASSCVTIVLSLHDLAQELQSRILICLGEDDASQLALALGPTAIAPNKKRRKA